MKVISFCLWGDNPKYLQGAIKNAELAKDIYPEWKLRYHVSGIEAFSSVKLHDCLIALSKINHNAEVFTMNWEPNWKLMLARFMPAADENVNIMLSRDCDSRLSLREKIAVDEWIASNKGFHTMHDHFHHSVPILGGMFGVKKDVLSDINLLIDDWLKRSHNNNGNYWQIDQQFLTNIVWPRIQNNVMNHADFHTNIWPGIPFKSKRIGREFVGATYDENNNINEDQMRCLWG
jgi:hypothetical protein